MTIIPAAAAPRPLMMLRLVAGRGAFRGSTQLMQLALVATWSAVSYGQFTNALGTCSWLVFVPTAAEKSALKIIPRTRVTQSAIAGLTLWIAAAPVLLVVAALLVALVVAPASTATLYLAAASWHASTGLLMTISGLHRLRGKPSLDALAFCTGCVLVLGATVVTWVAGWSPRTLLLCLVAGVGVVIGTAACALPRDWVHVERVRWRRLLPAFGRTTWLLGVSELLDTVTLSLIFLVLAASGRVTDSGPFYLALMASSFVCSFQLYRLKLHQPATSARLRGTGAATGRERAEELLRGVERAGAVFVALLGVGLLVPGIRAVLLTREAPVSWLVLSVLVLIEMALAIAFMYGGYLLENTNSRILKATSAAAFVRLVATAVLAVALVPPLGATGGFTAIILALSAEALALRRMLLRRHPELIADHPVPDRTRTP